MTSKARYSLPYKARVAARRCTAPSHLSTPGSHYCVDFYLPPGTPVLAARPGVVIATESRHNKSYDSKAFMDKCNYVVIRHEDGEESVYAHLAFRSVKVKRGDKVKRGRMIGLSGQTGYATYPHLHFGVYGPNDKNIRPDFNAPLPAKTSWKRYSAGSTLK